MKWGWLLGAVALAAFLVVRRRRLGRWLLVAGIVAVAAAAVVGVGLVELPKLEDVLLDVGRALGPWTYLVVGVLAFLETGAFVGLIAPGETTVIVGGVVAGQGEISLFVLIGITWACAVAGDLASYTAGRRLGRAWLLRHGERLKITEERLKQVEEFFERRGGSTILIGRFIGFVRALAPFIAGTSRHAAAQVPAVRRARRRRVVGDVRDARLRLLALVRPAHDLRVARAVRVRDRGRGDRRARLARAATARSGQARERARVAGRAPRPSAAGGRSCAWPGRSGGWSAGRPRAELSSPRASASAA